MAITFYLFYTSLFSFQANWVCENNGKFLFECKSENTVNNTTRTRIGPLNIRVWVKLEIRSFDYFYGVHILSQYSYVIPNEVFWGNLIILL